jgi:hypothetical protein
MKMNPVIVKKFDSSAEEKIFSLFEKTDLELGTTFHSLNIPEHERKQFAEADFVVVSVYGILVLEVKGGRLAVKDGIWIGQKRTGERFPYTESPRKQVETAWAALKKMLQKKSMDIDFQGIIFGFGLMFPDIKLGDIGIELPRKEYFDATDWDKRDLGDWLKKLYLHWRKKTKINKRLTPREVSIVCNAMRQEFDRERSLLSEVSESWDQMIALTEQQYMAVDMILANHQVVIEGGAGTGKTEIASRACQILDSKNKDVLLICRSPVLASFLGHRLKNTRTQVMNFDNLKIRLDRNEIPKFTTLVVDEGQDMLDMDSIEVLDRIFKNGFSGGNWYFFMDPNNQGSLYADFDQGALDYLKDCSTKVPLNRNCRNTRQIAAHTLLYTGSEFGECPINATGLPVIWKDQFYDTQQTQISLIETQLENWVDDEDVRLGEITILSPLRFEDSVASELGKRWRRKIAVINESYGERWTNVQLPFSTIRDFKGLENRYIMLVDMEAIVDDFQATNQLYVAMTRANTVLWMATPNAKKDWFDQRRSENAGAIYDFERQNK